MTYGTHAYFKKLVAKGVPEEQAEIHAEELKSIINSELATKRDLEIGLEKTKSEIIKWVVGVFLANSALMFSLFKFFD